MAAGGVLLPAHNAVLDGFFDHLQEKTQGIRLYVVPIWHGHTGKLSLLCVN